MLENDRLSAPRHGFIVAVLTLLALAAFLLIKQPALAQDVGEIGQVTRILGSASETMNGRTETLQAGSGVHAGSVIETGAGARLVIVFIDASQMTLGENAQLTMDEMVYTVGAEQSGSVSQAFEVFEGTFRYLSGAVARADLGRVSVTTPVATIGIRGTDFFGGPLASGMPPGELHYGFMILEGAIEVTSVEGSVTLDDPEEGTFLPMHGQAAPTPPTRWEQEAIDEAFASVAF